MIAYIYFFHDQFNAALIVNGLPSGIFGRARARGFAL